ncbi:hypothetical protein B7494_g3473 [Chlorociboria aeruginascens]|nr:hypothetical protein B7494_g3473 [Chlorociboria aeruginascens]
MFLTTSHPRKYFRQSETPEQQDYETSILQGHYPESYHPISTPDSNTITPKFKDETHPSLHGKMKALWSSKVKPTFSEATTDIHIVKNAIQVETHSKSETRDPMRFPEIMKTAEVRQGLELCLQERRFLKMRKSRVREAFATYSGLDIEDVHPDDVPIVGFGGSGGGFRAMIGVLGYCEEMKTNGLWDLFTYIAGVSGACWSLAAHYTFAEASWDNFLANCKERLYPYHPLSGEAIRELLSTPDGAYVTLGPIVQKHQSDLHIVAMDLYSVFITGHIFLRRDAITQLKVAGHENNWYKWTSAREHLADGKEPLPIITAVRHERPWRDWEDKDQPFGAPAGPLSSYIATIKRQLPPGFIGNSIQDLASNVTHFWGKQGTEEFENHHPLHASNEHNFMFHLSKLAPGQTYPPGLENSPRIHLVDSGMDNNCPTFTKRDSTIKPSPDTTDPDRFQGMYAQVYDGTLIPRPDTVVVSYGATVTNPPAPICAHECTMVYMPLLSHEKAVPGFDPSTAKFSGSYNLVWTPAQIDMLVKVCVQNFKDGEDTIKAALQDAWLRKKAAREGIGAMAAAAVETKLGGLYINQGDDVES